MARNKKNAASDIANGGLQIGPNVDISPNVPALNYKMALAGFTADEQKAIMTLAGEIDVRETDKIM